MIDLNKHLPNDSSAQDQRASPLLLNKWYRLTTPPEPSQGANFAQRDAARRGRLTSIVLLCFMTALLILLPIGLFGPSVATIAIGGGLLISSIALLFNRFARPNVAGLLITSYVFTALVTVILNSPGGLSTTTLGLFYALVFVDVLAASVLPVNWVLLAAAVNIIFVIADLSLQHKAPEFASVLSANFYPILSRIIVLHIFVVLVLWLWVRNATQAIKRADRAEELARSERIIQELQEAELDRKEELEKGIELILQTHVQVSNGDFQARAPLSQDNQLWQIAHSLNNLIVRMQHANQAEAELIYARETIAHLTSELQEARRSHRPMQIPTTRTFLDPFLQELFQLFQSQARAKDGSSRTEHGGTKQKEKSGG